jgi:hypothetical protein
VSEITYGEKVKIDVRDFICSAKRIQTALKNFNLIEFDKACDMYIDTIANGKLWALKYATTTADVFDTIFRIDDTTEVKNVLKRYARFRFLKGMRFVEDGLQAKVEIVFLKPNREIDYDKINQRTINGRLELQAGDEVYLKVKNIGNKSFYINIVDIQPNGIINPILPNKSETIRPEDLIVAKYDSILFDTYKITIGPPFGEETFKVFLSREKFDMEDILVNNNDRASRGAGGALNNMAKIFIDSDGNAIASRGGSGKVNTDQDGTIFNLNFTIKNK